MTRPASTRGARRAPAPKQAPPTTVRRRFPRDERRAEILRVATRVFYAKGYDAASLAVMTQMNVHSYAGSKRAELRTLATSKSKTLWQSESGPLNATLAEIRLGRHLVPGAKVVIFLDQFEQWLHANRDVERPELAQALRQCDGRRLQCVVMVRDDFWMAVTRFMQDLEVRLVEGQNSAAVDLFTPQHARKVLIASWPSTAVWTA